MNRRAAHSSAVVAGLVLGAAPGAAQTRHEFWPAAEAYVKLGARTRLYLLAAFTHAQEPEAASGAQVYRDAQFGAHLDFTLKPIFRPKLRRRGDWERTRYAWVRVGYRYGTSIGEVQDPYREHRGILEMTLRFPLPAGVSGVNRGRVDLRDVDGSTSTRFRYRLTLERETPVFGATIVPYVNAEFFYDSRFDDWTRQRYQAGVEVVLSDHWRIEPALVRQNDERAQPAHVNALALSLKYYR